MPSFALPHDPADLDFPSCLGGGQAFRWSPDATGTWHGADGDTWYSITPRGGTVDVRSNRDADSFVRLFRLDEDHAQIRRKIGAASPEMPAMIAAFPGLRVLRQNAAAEVLFGFICSQNNHIERITTMMQRLAEFGDQLDGGRFRAFPTVNQLARIDEADLRELKFGYRAPIITRTARLLVERGDGWLESLRQTTYSEAHAELVAIAGIGPKLADCIALFGLHFTEAVPVDTHIWQQVVRYYRPDWKGFTLTPRRLREAGDELRDRFGKHAGLAQQYLFHDNMVNWRSTRGTSTTRNRLE